MYNYDGGLMKMSKKTRLMTISVIVMSVSLLTACSSNYNAQTTTTKPASSNVSESGSSNQVVPQSTTTSSSNSNNMASGTPSQPNGQSNGQSLNAGQSSDSQQELL